ncbi:arylsulfatase [Corallococcus terminator]|uniref:Arylsulfatase n=1 Tax=Corallococcus terminator TaxID=2316733 RepID=A0A3A8J9N0_9BACT|nr:arylsulfatase [Corallococcus terminator]RKG91596.1 arylsulfatase [Corallococcus terminator]
MAKKRKPFEAAVPDSQPEKPRINLPPGGAPNIVVVLLDDVGFGTSSAFGGPVPMPTLEALSRQGLRYNQFHTTALCSPSRAALLTGRNHHSSHMGAICEIATGYPGYDSIIPKSTATLGKVLCQSGYNTAWFGKGHVTPMWEVSPAGPFDRWPTGLGFERFYGFLGGETSQWEPALYDQTTPISPYLNQEGYHLTEDLADQCISWIRNQKASAPEKPFFIYFAPGAGHSPHHVAKAWSDRFKGRFDQGWDALREQTHRRQLELGVIPSGTKLTARPEEIPSWEDYPDRYKPVASRLMEIFAGYLAHTDAQVGRVVESIQDLGVWENTLFIYVVGDNGASAEGTLHGAWSAPSFQNGVPEDPEWLLAHIDDLGTARCENHYNVGWAWSLDAPFQWMKQVASHFGGTRNATVISWPKGIQDAGGLRSQFHHLIDIMPTVLEAAGIPAPEAVDGVEQKPLEGVSMLYTFADKDAPGRHTTQYFEILGNRAMYHDGWIASCFHGRVPWIRSQSLPFGASERWELYNIADDFSQSEDLAARFPEKLEALKALFDTEARKYSVYPLDDNTTQRALPQYRPSLLEGQRKVTYYRENVRMPELAIVNMKNTSFVLTAELVVPEGGAEGVVVCQGGSLAGWSLYVRDGKPVYFYNWLGHEMYSVEGADPLPEGAVELKVVFDYDGGGVGKGGIARLLVNGQPVAEGRIEKTVPFLFSMSGETFDVGEDTGAPVGPYAHGFAFTGIIRKVVIELPSGPDESTRRQVHAGQVDAALMSQ